jgi:hypothetical protein
MDAMGGQVFIFNPDSQKEGNDWRNGSKHLFRQQNGGGHNVLDKDGEEGLERRVARIVTAEKKKGDPRFKRITWWYPSSPAEILFQVTFAFSCQHCFYYLPPFLSLHLSFVSFFTF